MALQRHHVPVLALILIFALLLSACTPPAPVSQDAAAPADSGSASAPAQTSSDGEDVLRVWITWGDNPAQVQALFDRYGAENGVRVEVNAPVDYDKVTAGLSGSEPPDVLVTSGTDDIGTWSREGLIISLDDYLDTGAVDLEDIYDASLTQCVYGGTHYCLPWGTDAYALFWNKDLFEDAGLDPESPPQTMEELAEMAKQLTKVDDNGQITQIGFIPNFSWSHLDLYVAMFGGYWYNEDGTELTLTSDAMVNALKWEQQFYCDYDTDEVSRLTSAFGGYASPDNGFYAGKIAMQVEGEWQHGPNFIQAFKPELFYGVAPFPPPQGQPENAGTVIVSGSVALIPSNVQNKDAAFDLLAWMVSPEILAEQMVANYNLPTSGAAAQDPRFRDNDKFVVHLDLASGEKARPPILSPINSEVNNTIEQIEEQVLFECADPLPLLEEAQARLQPELDRALSE